jgi:hypothetical protein
MFDAYLYTDVGANGSVVIWKTLISASVPSKPL